MNSSSKKLICGEHIVNQMNVLDEKIILERNKQIVNNVDVLIGCLFSKSEQLQKWNMDDNSICKKHKQNLLFFF